MTDAQRQACEFVQYILGQICENKETIETEVIAAEHEVIIMARVPVAEMGRAIGKEGQTISALRTLIKIIGARSEERLHLKIEELTA